LITRRDAVARITMPIKALAQRFAFLILLGAAGGVLMVGKADPKIFEQTRIVVTDAAAPILDAVSRPVATVASVVEEANYLIHLRDENVVLRQENARLLQWRSAAQVLSSENKHLRDLLRFVPDDPVTYISARVIADSGGAFVRSILVNTGSRDGVRKGFPVIVGTGLIGRVAEVGRRASRVLLINDLNSRIPVIVGPERHHAILSGDNSKLTRVDYLTANTSMSVGDRVLTSGRGGVFPPGLPIGAVTSVGVDGVRVREYVSINSLEYVRIMDFGLEGMIQEDRGVGQ
jgi:rod shape-determining protein MreC